MIQLTLFDILYNRKHIQRLDSKSLLLYTYCNPYSCSNEADSLKNLNQTIERTLLWYTINWTPLGLTQLKLQCHAVAQFWEHRGTHIYPACTVSCINIHRLRAQTEVVLVTRCHNSTQHSLSPQTKVYTVLLSWHFNSMRCVCIEYFLMSLSAKKVQQPTYCQQNTIFCIGTVKDFCCVLSVILGMTRASFISS